MEEIKKRIKLYNCLSLTFTSLVVVGSILGILDNNLIRDWINGEFKFKPAFCISVVHIIYNIILIIGVIVGCYCVYKNNNESKTMEEWNCEVKV